MTRNPDPGTDERLSIPLDPETALRELLKVDPDSEPVEDQEADEKRPKPSE